MAIFLHILIIAASFHHIQIIRLLRVYKSLLLGLLNVPLENLTRSIDFFLFLTITYDHPHHVNNQINIF